MIEEEKLQVNGSSIATNPIVWPQRPRFRLLPRISPPDRLTQLASSSSKEWEVTRVIGKRRISSGLQYRVEWAGFDPSKGPGRVPWEPSWEPVEHLTNSSELIREFEAILGVYGSELWDLEEMLAEELYADYHSANPTEARMFPFHAEFVILPELTEDEFHNELVTSKSVVYNYRAVRDEDDILALNTGIEYRWGWREVTLRIICVALPPKIETALRKRAREATSLPPLPENFPYDDPRDINDKGLYPFEF